MKWSVRDLLNFSYIPGINEAYEGLWNDGDAPPDPDQSLEVSMGLGWLHDEEESDLEVD